jgi:D-arabinose 1-dehydrogenase-like Zn-dependent alcohol dehydrogenase
VRIGGYVHVIGIVAGGGDLPSFLPALIITPGATLRGILVGSVAQFKEMNRAISAHRIRPVLDKVFDFEHLKEALEYLDSQKHVGKVVIKVARD